MKKKFFLLILLFILPLVGCVDQSGPLLEQSDEPSVVVTSVVVAEILDALDIDNVIGVPESQSFNLPERFDDVKRIGAPMSPDMEQIALLAPDWILAPVSLEADLAPQFANININAAFLNLSSIEGMYQSILELGELFDREEEAEALVEDFFESMDEFGEKIYGEESPTVLILMGLPGSYIVATELSYVGNLVKLAGGTNVYEDEEGSDFVNINAEDMLERDPDIILLTSHALPEQVEAMFEEEFAENEIWSHFRAVEDGRVYTLSHELFGMSANFRYEAALIELQRIFFGE